jgi:hypothetical protein
MRDGPVPQGENLRKAVAWLSAQAGPCTAARVQDASVRFDLSPQQEQFLLEHFSMKSPSENRKR